MSSALVRAGVVCAVAAGLAAAIAFAAERPPPAPSAAANVGAFEQLKPGPGRELVLANCLPCHSTAVIASAHSSRERWDQTITRMQKQNGLIWPLAPETRRQILDYLAATQPPSDPVWKKRGGRAGLQEAARGSARLRAPVSRSVKRPQAGWPTAGMRGRARPR